MGGPQINNAFYDTLGDKWYNAHDDPVALLRTEAAHRNPRVLEELQSRLGGKPCHLLDIGCGAGFLTNYVVQHGIKVTGVDLSEDSLEVARRHDTTGQVTYVKGAAEGLPFPDQSFDAVSCMDVLEHVESPGDLVGEAARVLKPGGVFIYYTFNRNPLTWLIVIKGVEWMVRNTPPHMHIYRLLVKPREMRQFCSQHGLRVDTEVGVKPVIACRGFWKLIFSGHVPPDFRFTFTPSLLMGYMGIALNRDTSDFPPPP